VRGLNLLIGTSGWSYPWNPDGLDWYAEHSGLNAVELNMSFYRLPFKNVVTGWSRKGRSLRWSVKVNRLITHVHRFNEKSYEIWGWITERFRPFEDNGLVEYYLFQLPPSQKPTDEFLDRLEGFIRFTGLSSRFALEGRSKEWFTEEIVSWAGERGITLVSVDAPRLPRDILSVGGRVYLRFHGRERWYTYTYSRRELADTVKRIREVSPESTTVFFNNDEGMLENARLFLELWKKMVK